MRILMIFYSALLITTTLAAAEVNDAEVQRFRQQLQDLKTADLKDQMSAIGFDRSGFPNGKAVDALIAESIKRDLEHSINDAWSSATGRNGDVKIVLGELVNTSNTKRLLFTTVDPELAFVLSSALGVPDEIILVPSIRVQLVPETRTRTLEITIDSTPRSQAEIERILPSRLSQFASSSPAVTRVNLSIPEVEVEKNARETTWFLRTSKKEYARASRHRLFYSLVFAIRTNPSDPRNVKGFVRFEHWRVPNGESLKNADFLYNDELMSMEQVASGVSAEDYRRVVPHPEATGVTDKRPAERQSPYRVAGELIERDSSKIAKMLDREVEKLVQESVSWFVIKK